VAVEKKCRIFGEHFSSRDEIFKLNHDELVKSHHLDDEVKSSKGKARES